MSLPAIVISARDHSELIMMIVRLRARVARLLISEIQRAEIAATVPADVVGIGSTVAYQLDGGPVETRVLTYPENVDPWSLSVSWPVGAALLGLRVGDAFSFESGDKVLTVRVVSVTPPVAPASAPIPANGTSRAAMRRLQQCLQVGTAGKLDEACRVVAGVTMTEAWRNHLGLRLICLSIIVLTFAVLFMQHRLLAWLGMSP